MAFAKKRHRVVTLSGEIVEMSGLMSGGGRPRKGLMNLGNDFLEEEQEYTKEDVRKLESEV